ncbi:hypothetical protein BASA61_007435 [Batrachochytrium salamandrivorans]|nr:hypothetical protein BASA61_007435 [Batrachochytrium salamandrivorans]
MFVPALTLILALASSTVIAVPMIDNVYKRDVDSLDPSSTELPFYFPESFYEDIPHSGDSPSPSSEEDDAKTATDFIFNRLNLGENDFKVSNSYTDSFGIGHVYGTHMVNGVGVANHQAAAHVKNGKVTFFSSSFGTDQHLTKRDLIISEANATLSFETGGLEVWCATTTGEIVQAINFAKKASYKVVQIPRRDPTEGFSVVTKPEFIGSSPKGWTDGNATEGNNVITKTPSGKTTPSTKDGVFDTKFNGDDEPDTDANIAAAAVNLFYLSNIMHDISYQYGFTEKAGNFQKDNFGKGGQGGDAVTINVLNPSSSNDATFFAPADGRPGVMNMFRFTITTPNRSGGLDNGIVLHEYAHGITSRLTGGAATSGCLSTDEAGGMSEGWSDIMAMMVLAKDSDTATTGITIGAYIINNLRGFRSHPYTTNMTVNPLTYGGLKARSEVHDVGEVWASMLWEVYWGLVTKHGFSTNLYDTKQSAGNIVTMKIIIGGLMLQSCNPTFLGARDAIIAADKLHYKSANKCEIYKAFAKRGLGLKATDTRTDDFSVPPECQ